jgi:dipeptidase D
MTAAGVDFALVSVTGSSKRNAIPREAFAVLHVDAAGEKAAAKIIRGLQSTARAELKGVDEGVTLRLKPTKADMAAMTPASQAKVLDFLMAVPHGLIAYSRAIHGLVETSTNFAIIITGAAKLEVGTSQRSSVMSQLDWAAKWVASIGRLSGASVKHSDAYPGWKPDLDSALLKTAKATHKRLFKVEPKVLAIHAGLECGIIGAKYPGMEMISIGPEIRNAHSPDEEVNVASVKKTYRYLLELLKDLA